MKGMGGLPPEWFVLPFSRPTLLWYSTKSFHPGSDHYVSAIPAATISCISHFASHVVLLIQTPADDRKAPLHKVCPDYQNMQLHCFNDLSFHSGWVRPADGSMRGHSSVCATAAAESRLLVT